MKDSLKSKISIRNRTMEKKKNKAALAILDPPLEGGAVPAGRGSSALLGLKRSRRLVTKKSKSSTLTRLKKGWIEALQRRTALISTTKGHHSSNHTTGDVAHSSKAVEDRDNRKDKMNAKYEASRGVFLKNLTFDFTEDVIAQYLSLFGAIQRVLLVKNRTTQHVTGSAFVYFSTVESAEMAIQKAEMNAREEEQAHIRVLENPRKSGTGPTHSPKQTTTWQSARQQKRQVFRKGGGVTSLMTALSSASHRVIPYVLFGEHRVHLLRLKQPEGNASATDRNEGAEKSGATVSNIARPASSGTSDARNLYLIKEGYISPGSSAAEGVPPPQMELRENLFQMRCQKLRNPNFHISATRLCIHNLPPSCQESQLHELCRQFGRLQQVKIMYETAPASQSPNKKASSMSKGYAFVQYAEHHDALTALRSINNNPKIFGPLKRPIVEFALDNVRVLQKLQQRHS